MTVIPMNSGVKSFHQTPSSAILVLPNQRIHFCCLFILTTWGKCIISNLQARTSLLRGTYYFDLSCFHPVKSRIVTIGPTWIVVPHLRSVFVPLRFISYIHNSGQINYNSQTWINWIFLGGATLSKPRFGVTSAEVAMFEWVAQHGYWLSHSLTGRWQTSIWYTSHDAKLRTIVT